MSRLVCFLFGHRWHAETFLTLRLDGNEGTAVWRTCRRCGREQ